MTTIPSLQSGSSASPGDDMQALTLRIRAWLDIDGQREVRMPLGGATFDVVISGGGKIGRAGVAVMDDIQVSGCGPVIEDSERGWLYWLVPPGTAKTWTPHSHGVCLGEPHTLTLPTLSRSAPPGPYWLRPCVSDRLVPPQPLRDLLGQFRPTPTPHAGVDALLGCTTV